MRVGNELGAMGSDRGLVDLVNRGRDALWPVNGVIVLVCGFGGEGQRRCELES